MKGDVEPVTNSVGSAQALVGSPLKSQEARFKNQDIFQAGLSHTQFFFQKSPPPEGACPEIVSGWP